ncbi:MAG: MFS transporter [Dehalococcoidia bacterium]|nr:MFS transporter [Dehalococcoidia bacterium]
MKIEEAGNAGKGTALFVAGMASFLTPFVGSSVNVALPSIGKEFALSAISLDWIVTSYLLAAAIFLVPLGRLADIKGRKKIFIYGIIIDAAGSILAAISQSGIWLTFFRVLQGIGGAMIFGTGVAIVASVFPVRERGKALGIIAAAVYTGLSLGPPLGGLLTEYFSWRSIFVIDALLGMSIIIAVLWKLKGEWAEAKGEKFDAIGSVIYGLSLLAMMYGFSVLPNVWAIVLIVAGIAGLGAFIMWENRVKSPVLDMSLFKNSMTFSMSNLAALINYSATFAVAFLMSLYLQYIKGFDPEITGFILLLQPVIMAVLSPIAGRLSDKIEPRWIASIGMLLTTVGLVLLIFLGPDTQIVFILFSFFTLGVGFGLFSSPNTTAVMKSVEKEFYGVASGTLATMRLIGQMLSLGIVMLLFAVYIGRVQITPEYYQPFLASTKAAFVIFAILCFGGIFASLSRGKTMDTVREN